MTNKLNINEKLEIMDKEILEQIEELEMDIQYHQSEKKRLSESLNSDKDLDEYNDNASELEYLQLKLERLNK